jgi:hypothetical protein
VASTSNGNPSHLYTLEFALRLPIGAAPTSVTLVDDSGAPLVINGVAPTLSLSNCGAAPCKPAVAFPEPVGQKWYMFTSDQLLTPIAGSSSFGFAAKVMFPACAPALSTPVCKVCDDQTVAVWVSDNRDDLYGEVVNDYYKEHVFELESAQPLGFSEILVNPPGADDGQEAIEIRGPPNFALTGFFLVIVEGDGSSAGTVDVVLNLTGLTTGSNGLLLIRDSSSPIAPGPAAATSTVVIDFNPDLENGSCTFILGSGIAPSIGSDLDSDNDGSLNVGALTGFTTADAVSILENDGPANVGYADDLGFFVLGPFSGPAPLSHNPDVLYRIYNPDGTKGPWAGGDVIGTNPGGPYSLDVGAGTVFGFAECDIANPILNLGTPNPPAPDTDGDGISDCRDGCPTDPTKEASCVCGCGISEGCSLGIDVSVIPAAIGGMQVLKLFGGPALAGKLYLVLGSLPGTTPGLPLKPGVSLPLNYDFYMQFTLAFPNPLIANSFGTLDNSGNAIATFSLPPSLVALPFPVTLNHAWIGLSSGGVPIFASNAAPLILNP